MASVYSLKVSTWAGLLKASAFGPRTPLAFPPLGVNCTCGLELRAWKRVVSVCCVCCFFPLIAFLLDCFFPLIAFFLRSAFDRSVQNRKGGGRSTAKKKEETAKKNDPMSASESEEIQEEAGDAWLPSIVPGTSASWGVKARDYAEISATLEAPGGERNKGRKRKSARSSIKSAPHKLSKSERTRQQA